MARSGFIPHNTTQLPMSPLLEEIPIYGWCISLGWSPNTLIFYKLKTQILKHQEVGFFFLCHCYDKNPVLCTWRRCINPSCLNLGNVHSDKVKLTSSCFVLTVQTTGGNCLSGHWVEIVRTKIIILPKVYLWLKIKLNFPLSFSIPQQHECVLQVPSRWGTKYLITCSN